MSLPRVLVCAALALASAVASAQPSKAGFTSTDEAISIRALHYGDTLFSFFQDKHFSAITGLMASQQFERIAEHRDEAEVLRGGLLLSYGVHRQAAEIFEQLIAKGAAPSVRDRAWFYLAKIRYQRGLPGEAEAALAQIGQALPLALVEERGLLQAQLLMARGDYAGAAAQLAAMTARQPNAFAQFNLGVALVKSGELARGNALLEQIGRSPADNEEQRSLRDRANLALGVAALQQQRSQEAGQALERVRLSGLQANQALLALGWAAAAQKQPGRALVAWAELGSRDASDPAVLEARIALPHAHAEMGAWGPSLRLYEVAVSAFDSERLRLDASIGAIRSGKLVEGLLRLNPAGEMGWFGQMQAVPEMPHGAHLAQVLAQHDFQEAFKNLRDLLFLERNLQQWRENLVAYRDMLAHRREAFAARLPQIREGASGTVAHAAALRQRRDRLAADLAAGQTQADGLAFADARELALLSRIEGLQAALRNDCPKFPCEPTQPEIAALADRVRLAAGVMNWQLAQALPERRWAAQRTMTEIDARLQAAAGREAALAQAQHDEPARLDALARRIEAVSAQLDQALPQVAALSREQQGAAQQIAQAALARQQQRLVAYSTQARFEIAQLLDRATVASKDQHASR